MFSQDAVVDAYHMDDNYVYNFDSDMNYSVLENANEFFQPKTLQNAAEEQIIVNLTSSKGREHLSAKREYVNSLPVKLKNRVWNKILNYHDTDEICLESLEVFLDERTKFFSFMHPYMCRHILPFSRCDRCQDFHTILKLIARLAPNIEDIDFTHIYTNTNGLKDDFKFFLKTCTKLKSLRLNAYENCPFFDLFFSDFNSIDKDIQIALQSIKIYNLNLELQLNSPSSLSQLSNIFINLPNLESLGSGHYLGAVINHYVKLNDTKLNLTDIYDYKTNLSTLEIFAKFCPKAKFISLYRPQEKVVQNLYKLPLLTEIKLDIFDNNELIKYLTRNGKNIKKLELWNDKSKIEKNLLKQLCPNIEIHCFY